MRRKAYAKVTLTLQLVKRDREGVHFDNVIVPIDLFDMVYLDVADKMMLQTNKDYLPLDQRNTVYHAIMLMKERYNITDNFSVRIVKNIPAQAGLGGGSADAAAIIHLIDEKYNLNLTLDEKIDIGRQIDEDTPFCLVNKPARVQGIGDVIQPIPLNIDLHYLIVKPPYGISTKRFLKRIQTFEHDAVITESMIQACKDGDYQTIIVNRINEMQKNVLAYYPKLKNVIHRLEKLGLDGICMSGSGTSIVGFSQDIETVRIAYERIALKYPFVKYGTIKAQDMVE
ncbi:4-diphosphocytidyl-2C-methyl-D-erythritol kinase [Erysipelothrix larvae]|uniref:4-diphosphocytidyl-2-C-methyl-D-erythritol kinase n=1 Tax=Erysipelothrix larvae TaxID=1514105 RepID=A0A0X8GXX5_9FIRM|nr:4-(cytidine 5'-diphospho)-2-C-methyl-D-erythritol kinase [Erysipelothrix larvae]AMC92467.1 4-diphosphocytidyl-2C-methyl-D-erythritol kinase [Erysipelothrix larvae]